MNFIEIYKKIGKQNISDSKKDAYVYINNKNYYITNIEYDNGIIIGFKAVHVGCESCKKYKDKLNSDNCDFCINLDEDSHYMWEWNGEKDNQKVKELESYMSLSEDFY